MPVDIVSTNMGVPNATYSPQITNERMPEYQVPQAQRASQSKAIKQGQNQSQMTNMSEFDENTSKQDKDISEDELVRLINETNKKLKGVNTEFKFDVHEQTKQILVKIINTDTKEVIRELPPEKVLDMLAKMWEMAGIIIDKKG